MTILFILSIFSINLRIFYLWHPKSNKMKNLYTSGLLFLIHFTLNAQIAGPNSGGSFTTIVIPGSIQTWSTPSNAASSDNIYTTFGNLAGGVGSYTDYLVATNFGFSIPSGVTINGIIVEVERADPNFRTSDYSIRIVKGGVVGATERSFSSGYPSTDSYQSYGNAGDLWGETWNESDINASGFGVAIAAQRSVSGGTTAGRIDHVRIIVFYDFTLLPVRLIQFSGQKKNKSIELSWTTTDEISMSHYVVERSKDARNFSSLLSVVSRNQLQQTVYSAVDANPLNGISYYRLKTVESNGTVKYSRIISVQLSTGNSISIYPTIWKSGSVLNITNPENEILNILLYNLSGQLMGSSVTNSSLFTPVINPSVKGTLIYNIRDEQGMLKGSGQLFSK